MPNSGSARLEGPRTAKDPLEEPYEQMIARQRAHNAALEDEQNRKVDHPGTLESMIPIWGSGKEALADLEDKNYAGAAINAGLAVSDVVIAKAVLSGLAKGGLKVAGPHVWRTTFPERKAAPKKIQGAREWMGEMVSCSRGSRAITGLLNRRPSGCRTSSKTNLRSSRA